MRSSLAPGYRLDRYELLCPIADGGMASVWIARQRGKHGFEKLVAIKTILPKFAEDLRFQQMFLDEARIASKIEHANVAQIHDLGEEHGILFLAMEWVDGDALSKLRAALERRGGLIPPGIVLRILADTCSGLHAAHQLRGGDGTHLGVVHRDVSPQNILVSVRGMAKLIDFGIAKARDRVADETNAGLIKGKIQYMSPEQAMGNEVDCRADVWAVGAILYHLLSGKPPYEGENQLATLHVLTSGSPPPPLPASVHPEIAAVVRRSLAHDPARRFHTAEEMQEAIEHAMYEAGLQTTTADVAAFVNEHMADRALARKEAIDIAVHAAQERARVEELLRPARDSVSPIAASRLSNSGALTAPAIPMALGGPPPSSSGIHAAPQFGGIRTDPPEATLGSAALEAPAAPRRGSMAALVAALIVALVCAIGLIAFLATRAPAGPSTAAARPAASATPSASASAKPTATTTGSAPAATASASSIAADALPSATAAKPLLPYAPRPFPSAQTPPQQKKSIDDGF
jgi:serine/threonine-protein kinase